MTEEYYEVPARIRVPVGKVLKGSSKGDGSVQVVGRDAESGQITEHYPVYPVSPEDEGSDIYEDQPDDDSGTEALAGTLVAAGAVAAVAIKAWEHRDDIKAAVRGAGERIRDRLNPRKRLEASSAPLAIEAAPVVEEPTTDEVGDDMSEHALEPITIRIQERLVEPSSEVILER